MDKEIYASIVGSIGWPAKQCYGHLGQAYSMLSRNVSNPRPCDARSLKRILQYIYHHLDEAFYIIRPQEIDPKSKFLSLMVFTDSNYGDAKDIEFRATSGYCIFLGGIVASWRAKRQDTTSTSTFHAEMQAAYAGAEQGCSLRHLLIEIEVIDGSIPTPFFADNETLVLNCNKLPEDCSRVHICTKFFHVAGLMKDGTFRIFHIPGDVNPAGIFTKVIPVPDYAR